MRVASRNRTLAHIRRFEKMADEVARPKIVFTGLPEGASPNLRPILVRPLAAAARASGASAGSGVPLTI